MFYPLNLMSLDPNNNSIRPFIIFAAFENQPNLMKLKTYADIAEPHFASRGGFALPMPNTGLIDSSQNQYTAAPSLAAGLVNKVAEGKENFMSQSAGIVPDPKFTQVYMGATPRTWSGTWQLIPQSMAESAMVAAILRFIKFAAAPDKKSGLKNKIGVLIEPWVFEIKFSNLVIQDAMKFNRMALASYQINYFAQGYSSTYFDMMPKQIELTLTFQEFGIKTKKDWMSVL